MRNLSNPTSLDFHSLVEHFLALSSRDRILRFGKLLSAADICDYVDSMLRAPKSTLMVREPLPDLAGVMNLVFHRDIAVLGLSVACWARGQGIGALLLHQAALLAQMREVRVLYACNLRGNPALRRLAQRIGFNVACVPDAVLPQRAYLSGSPEPLLNLRSENTITLADLVLHCPGGISGDRDALRVGDMSFQTA